MINILLDLDQTCISAESLDGDRPEFDFRNKEQAEKAVREPLAEGTQPRPVRHGSGDGHHPLVLFGQLDGGSAEHRGICRALVNGAGAPRGLLEGRGAVEP